MYIYKKKIISSIQFDKFERDSPTILPNYIRKKKKVSLPRDGLFRFATGIKKKLIETV